MTREELTAAWLHQRAEFLRVGAFVNGAQLIDEHLAHLEKLSTAEAKVALTLREAADRSGFSPEYLAKLVRQGRIPQAGTKGRPRIYAKDLPLRHPGPVAPRERKAYDVNADARTLRDWRQ